MRTLEELVSACTPILISGSFLEGGTFEGELSVILPDWTMEEESEHHDALVEYWFDRDYWCCFYKEEDPIDHVSEEFGIRVDSYRKE